MYTAQGMVSSVVMSTSTTIGSIPARRECGENSNSTKHTIEIFTVVQWVAGRKMVCIVQAGGSQAEEDKAPKYLSAAQRAGPFNAVEK